MSYLLSAYGFLLLIMIGYIVRVNLKCGRLVKEAGCLSNDQKSISKLDSSKARLCLIGFALLFISVALYMALIWSPDAKGEPATYRIIYFHVAAAFMSYVGFFITFAGSILYLWKRDLRFDRWAKVGADLGVHFCALMIITGMIWGKQRWGAWWIWEPRLTLALVLLVIYVGYLILRHVMENPVTTARYASVYGIIGFIDVPLVHYSIKLWGKIMHPVVTDGGKNSGLAPEMMLTLEVSIIAFLIVFAAMYIIRLHVDSLEANLSRCRT
ncbi:MAG: cytochrome c biogenesis protein CcsA [Nitrospinota bacterium]|nr:cytochrome c biogenesis protein CcsA [Nitrospinota bacterium]MDP7580133.1 cytochrome c biogenesis protein CcsA [Nitrospinota bacterium]HJN02410.1 cytochrome c biogenesis protein CcsA [Nitrospinota bacterium]